MINEIREWIKWADEDLQGAKILLKGGGRPWIIAYHAQQAVEKYLKAYLIKKGVRFRKTHDISELLKHCIGIDSEFQDLREIEELTIYATETRYPGFSKPTLEEAEKAVELAEKAKTFILKKLEI